VIEYKYYEFDEIYIERSVKDHKYTKRILEKIKKNPIINYIDDINKLIKSLPAIYHPIERSKKLLLSNIRGEILQKCPGSLGHICCNYYVINLYIGCPLNCAYCILQSYLNQPFTIINVDVENIFDYLRSVFEGKKDKYFRVGTGELGDSLVYDYLTGFSADFIDFFSRFKNACFEFKTKTDYIDNILNIDSPGNIIVGFSVNPDILINEIETDAVGIEKRLIASSRLQAKGYKIAIHFDPIVNIDNFEMHYSNLIDRIFKYISCDNIAWISLGTFRYTGELKNMMEYNYPNVKLLYEEFQECADKKYRYFMKIRLRLYRIIIEKLRSFSSGLPIYLCMESPFVWENTLGYSPSKSNNLKLLFGNKNSL
jgi:spore photoproduct lyase